MLRMLAVTLTTLGGMALTAPAAAQLGPASYSQFTRVDGPDDPFHETYIYAPGSFSYAGPQPRAVAETNVAADGTALSAHAESNGIQMAAPSDIAPGVVVTNSITFNFFIDDPLAMTPVAVRLGWSGSTSASVSPGSFNAYASATLSVDNGYALGHSYSATANQLVDSEANSWSLYYDFNVAANVTHSIVIQTHAETGFAAGVSGSVNGAAFAQVSAVQLGFLAPAPGATLITSDGLNVLAPVPEPGEWAMMMAGLAVVGFTARRRRKR